jgi:hypothetical protein
MKFSVNDFNDLEDEVTVVAKSLILCSENFANSFNGLQDEVIVVAKSLKLHSENFSQ